MLRSLSWTLAACLALAVSGAGAEDTTPAFEIDRLAEGVFLFRPLGEGTYRTNSLVVDRADGPLVVDAQPSPEAARALIEAVRSISAEPIRYLLLSHVNAESAGGASAFPESTLVIGARRGIELLEDEKFDFGGKLRERSASPGRWAEPPRRPPVLGLVAQASLEDPQHPVEMAAVTHGYSEGGMLVRLPEEDLIYVGPLLHADGNPWAGQADIGGWLGTLNHLANTRPALIVPSHGPSVDVRTVRRQRDGLAWLRGQVERCFIDGISAERIRARLLEEESLSKYFDVDASPSFLPLLVDRVVAETVDARRARGLE